MRQNAEADAIAARVNGEIIRFSQLDAESEPYIPALREKLKGNELVNAVQGKRRFLLEQMIDRTLLLQELRRRGVRLEQGATDEKIDAAIKERFHSDRTEWLKWLKLDGVIENYYFPAPRKSKLPR
jgi:parvulin-like peptidyl-prolyl isomerase